jgi:hypothetical protein
MSPQRNGSPRGDRTPTSRLRTLRRNHLTIGPSDCIGTLRPRVARLRPMLRALARSRTPEWFLRRERSFHIKSMCLACSRPESNRVGVLRRDTSFLTESIGTSCGSRTHATQIKSLGCFHNTYEASGPFALFRRGGGQSTDLEKASTTPLKKRVHP